MKEKYSVELWIFVIVCALLIGIGMPYAMEKARDNWGKHQRMWVIRMEKAKAKRISELTKLIKDWPGPVIFQLGSEKDLAKWIVEQITRR